MPGRLFLRAPPPIKKRPCSWTLTSPAVLPNGDFRLCECRFGQEFLNTRRDELVVGNVHSETIGEMWFGDKTKQVRRMFIERAPPEVCIKYANYLPA